MLAKVGRVQVSKVIPAVQDASVTLVVNKEIAGSATLARIAGKPCLLTADHVWDGVKDRVKKSGAEEVQIVARRIVHYLGISFHRCIPFTIGKFNEDTAAKGPDLTVVAMDDDACVSTLESIKSFHVIEPANLANFDEQFLKKAVIVWGSPSETSETGKPTIGRDGRVQVVGMAHQLHSIGKLEEVCVEDGFDYLAIEVPSGRDGYPNSFKGVSGGGVWLPFRKKGAPTIRDACVGVRLQKRADRQSAILVGVCFHQSPHVEGNRILRAHGPKSLVRALTEASRWLGYPPPTDRT